MSFKANMLWDIARAYAIDNLSSSPLYDQMVGYIRSRNVKGICELGLPNPALHGEDFRHIRQIKAFFSKNAEFTDMTACSESAKKSFLEAEQLCQSTNDRLRYPYYQQALDRDPDLIYLITESQRIIDVLLGDIRKFFNRLPQLVKITGGATEDRPRRKALPFLKISRKLRCTTLSKPLLLHYLRYVGYTKEPHVTCVDSNRIVFVPKNYKTFRTIACEPTASLPFQLAFDSFAKEQLRKEGCSLFDQLQNSEKARIGSLHNSFCTLDLSMASDTLAYETVRWLLPRKWFTFLDSLRAIRYRGEVGQGKYAKFSSMGNGSTFSLESLIFFAFLRASGSRDGSVYGDDIIIEPQYLPKLLKLLEFFGFRVNHDKSYTDGPFRESCGKDWLNGELITPFYVRSLPKTPSELSHFVNGLVRVSVPYGEVWKILRNLSANLLLVPESFDSGSGVHIPYHTARAKGLLVYNSRKYGPYVPCCCQYVTKDKTFGNSGIKSYLVWLLFGKKGVSSGVRFLEGRLVTDDVLSFTKWSSGFTSRRRELARVEPWPLSSDLLLLWADYLLEASGGHDLRPDRKSVV